MELIRKYTTLFWTGLTFFVSHHSVLGQTTVTLEEYETRNLVFSGHIGEGMDMPVTFCLNVENMSPGHADWYSVSGWYQYDRHETPIPLAGVYTGLLTLYRFAEEESVSSLLNFHYDDDGRNFMRMMELSHEKGDFLEKMTVERVYGKFEDGAGSGSALQGAWSDGNKHLPLRIYRADVDVLQRFSFLKISHNGTGFEVDLKALSLPVFYPGNHSIAGYKVVDGKIRIVLSYDRPSRSYALGMCGAGNESGFLRLELDENGHLLALNDYRIESCLLNIVSDPGYRDENEENYTVTDGEGLGWFLHFNKETMELKWVEGG